MPRTPLARVLALAMAVTAAVPPILPAAIVLVASSEALAQARRSSGGYSRPGGGSRSYSAPSRTPSSGGYARPSLSPRTPSINYGGSAGDRAFGREQSGSVLRDMRAREDAARRAAEQASRPAPVPAPAPQGGGWGGSWGRGSTGGGWGGAWGGSWGGGYATPRIPRRGYDEGGWFRGQGYNPAGGMLGSSFGPWSAAFLFFLLSTLNRPGHADFFRNNQDSPAFREFRQAAEERAASDPEIARQLQELDRRLEETRTEPREPGALPPGIPPEVARAKPEVRTPSAGDAIQVQEPTGRPVGTERSGAGGGLGGTALLVALLILGLVGFLAWRRLRARAGGDGTMGTGDTLRAGADMVRNKMSGQPYAPSRFRVGMTLTVDPTPFLLLGGDTKVPAPTGTEMTSVTAVGRIGEGAGSLVRLYLPDGAFFQLHLGAGNEPDECRYFALLDEVHPADESEWNVWLDRAEGMIGWPEFQTKDGKVYGRAWSPSDAKIAPRTLTEEVEGTEGRRTVRSQTMLYAAPTGAAAPAPETEYILVSAVEDGSGAWVEIRAGLDISVASLSLA